MTSNMHGKLHVGDFNCTYPLTKCCYSISIALADPLAGVEGKFSFATGGSRSGPHSNYAWSCLIVYNIGIFFFFFFFFLNFTILPK